MSKMKRLATVNDSLIKIETPLSAEGLRERSNLYDELPPKKFKFYFSKEIYNPVYFELNGELHTIQVNHCANPFCKNYGVEQAKLIGKSTKYKLSGNDEEKVIICGKDTQDPDGIQPLGCTTRTISNWSVTTEIERLHRINTVLPIELTMSFIKNRAL